MFRKFILKNENMNGWKDSNHEQWQIHVPSVIDTSIKYINQNTEISASVTQACYLIRISYCWVCARKMELQCLCSGPLFTEQWDVLLPNLMKSQSREIGCYNAHIALKFDRHLDSAAFGVSVKFLGNWKSLNLNLAASRFYKILR